MKYIIILVLAALLLMSCTTEPTDNEQDNKQEFIFPLSVGNYWHYDVEVIFVSCNGDDLECHVDQNVTFNSTTVTEEYNLLRNPAFILQNENGQTFVNENTEAGFVQHGYLNSSGNFFEDEKLIVKSPIEVGDTWVDIEGALGNTAYECTSVNEEVTVPAGTFTCFVFRRLDEMFTDGEFHYYYYAKDIGLVKELWHKEIHIEFDESYPIPTQYQDKLVKELDEYIIAE